MGEQSLTLTTLLNKLNDYAVDKTRESFIVISFDEAQLLAGGKGRIDFRSIMAYAYDNLRGLRLGCCCTFWGLMMLQAHYMGDTSAS
ncbi:hypothetical protein KEJ48_07465 [Candidatus Bathyarchaeota archaeon]|nr:hypothetical protein [Candidatus Bathyarchaeota archaeon]